MLAVIGFVTTALLFLVFALTLKAPKDDKTSAQLEKFKRAYIILAITFLNYGIASALKTPRILALSVIIGNFLLLGATLLIGDLLLADHKQRKQLLIGLGLVGLGLILVRILFFYPKPYIADSILVFNSQRLVSFCLSAAFLLIWFPVNLHVSHLLTIKQASLSKLYGMLYATATFSAIIFLLSKAPLTLALSFTALSLSFAVMIISNFYINALEGASHGSGQPTDK